MLIVNFPAAFPGDTPTKIDASARNENIHRKFMSLATTDCPDNNEVSLK